MKFNKIFNKMNQKEQEASIDDEKEMKEQGSHKEEKSHKKHHENKAEKKGHDEENKELEELQNKVNELNDKFLRLYSEYDNYRKRTAKERIDLIKFAGEDIFKSLLPVLDDFERAIKVNEETKDINAVKEGVDLIYNKFKNTLTQQGIQVIEPENDDFNTDIHEAVTNIPAPSEELKGKVIEQLEKGYTLNGKVIRYAKVVVGS